MCPSGKKRANRVPNCVRQSMASRSKVDDSPPLSTDEATTGALCPVLGSPIQERYRQMGWGPVKGHQDGASLLWRKAEAGISFSSREGSEWNLSMCTNTSWRGQRRWHQVFFNNISQPSARTFPGPGYNYHQFAKEKIIPVL